MTNRSITSANSRLSIILQSNGVATDLAVTDTVLSAFADIVGIPLVLEGWAADQAFSTAAVTSAEVVQGVDGQKHAGWVPSLVTLSGNVMPDTDTAANLGRIFQAQRMMRETFIVTGTLIVPALARSYSLNKGTLTQNVPIPAHNRVQAAQTFQIVFESAEEAPY